MTTQELNLIPIYEPTALALRADMEKTLDALALEADKALAISIIDTKTYKRVHEQQMILREKRIEIEKARKYFTEVKQKEVKDAIQIEKDLVSIISEKEDLLKEKKEAYDKEVARKKIEEEAKKQAKITARIQALAQYGITYDTINHGTMSDEDFDALIATKKQEFEEVEKARLAQIESDRMAREKFEEDQRKFREEQAEFARKNKEAQDKIDADRKAIEDEKNAIEKARVDAENAKIREQELKDAQEKARLQGIEDARIAQERKENNERLANEARIQAEKDEQEKLEKKKKYQAWLIENWAENGGIWKAEKSEDGKKMILWKYVSEFII